MESARLPALVLAIAAVATATGSAQSSGKQDLLDRATACVLNFVERFTSVVAEELYLQETRSPSQRRELKSDFLLVRPQGFDGWLQFRDVFEVNGRPVRARAERLTALFLDSPENALARAVEVAREGARFNLEDIGTLNQPLTALGFLQPAYAPRFRFTVGPLDKNEGPGVRLVQYREVGRPTVLHTDRANGDLPARGRVWIEEATGRIMKTEMLVGGAQITTSYRFDDDLQVIVPVEMRESYRLRTGPMTGVAKYGRFRRFGVSTEEQLKNDKPQ